MSETIIVVGKTELDQWGNLLVTPQGGGERVKIAAKRSQLHPLFEQGKAVILDWQTYQNKSYVANAKAVEGKLEMHPEELKRPQVSPSDIAPQERGMWWKELGEMIRAKEAEATATMKTAYYTEMGRVLNINLPPTQPKPLPDELQSTTALVGEVLDSKVSTDPKTWEELVEYCAKKLKMKDTKGMKAWMVNRCKVSEDEFTDTPSLLAKIKKEMKW